MATGKISEVPDPQPRKKRSGGATPIPAPPLPPPPVLLPQPMVIPEIAFESMTDASNLSPGDEIRLRKLLAEKAMRKLDSLRLYEAMPAQMAFHTSASRLNLLRGSNRGGKTLPAAVEVARAVCGMDPFKKYPVKDGRCFAVGKDLKHIGEVMWRKLSRPGAFRIIRDELTSMWRAFRPWDPADAARAHTARPAPALIPKRMIADIAWENKKEGVPSKVKLTTGWEITFFSSLGKPPQGSDIDLWWFDEEIVDPLWFPEMSARTLDRQGRGIWSATPQAGTEQLYELHERAERERYDYKPSIQEHVILLADNVHIREEDKQALAKDLSEDDRRVRIEGEFAIISFRVYPEFNMLVHGKDLDIVPRDWCKYMIVDPGHQVCAVLFVAIPPDDSEVVAYDELYLRDCDAMKFAINVAVKTKGDAIQASVIDPNMAVHTELGTGKTVGQQYSEALDSQDFAAIGTGVGFILGCDDTDAGLLAVHGLLRMGPDGKPRFRVIRGRCPHLEDEFKRYVKKRQAGVVIDQPNNRKNNHLMDNLRYLALFNPRWVKPRVGKPRQSPAMVAFRKKREKQKSQRGSTINLGPGKGFSHG